MSGATFNIFPHSHLDRLVVKWENDHLRIQDDASVEDLRMEDGVKSTTTLDKSKIVHLGAFKNLPCSIFYSF